MKESTKESLVIAIAVPFGLLLSQLPAELLGLALFVLLAGEAIVERRANRLSSPVSVSF